MKMNRAVPAILFTLLAAATALAALCGHGPVVYDADRQMAGARFWDAAVDVEIPEGFRVIPRQLPGPMDIWAGGGAHEFSFIARLRGGEKITLRVLDSHESHPPLLDILADGRSIARLKVSPGAGQPDNLWETRGKRAALTFTVPETDGGPTRITVRNIAGSWVAFDSLEIFTSARRWPLALFLAIAWLGFAGTVAFYASFRRAAADAAGAVAASLKSPHGVAVAGFGAVGLYVCAPLFGDGYFFSHEEFFPFYRVKGIDLAVASGQIPPKVLPNLANGFGYGWNIFYPPLRNTTGLPVEERERGQPVCPSTGSGW